ncbi:c-type cytochrome [Marinicella sp. S1101]|uniref:c-type cytochrome n=1 Tax=Marinicella marina TaxID=2996016 RepID=UPI002260FB3A|nr:c-type cytochrome [Marinicella marina]MCX7552696.1 c-type cytochrome [Marinicella marina]MDJ1139572.1 c-type cytochrome [Marinicella marina]
MSNKDSIFFRNFSILLAALVVLTVALILVGMSMQNNLVANIKSEADRSAIAELIKPVAAVNTDPNAIVELEPAALAAAFDGSLDGEMIYNNACAACHVSGAGGAPKLEAAAWELRLAQGMDKLVQHAIEGFVGDYGMMPARGGNAALTDEQVKVTVEYMTAHLE